MRKRLVHTLLLFLFSAIACAQATRFPVSSIHNQLTPYGTFTNAFSFTSNQAALASVTQFSAGIYGEKRYLMQQLGMYQAALCFPGTGGAWGFKADYFGNILFNESTVGLSYGRKLGDHIDAGIQFNYCSFRQHTYGSITTFNAEAGAIIHASDQLCIGLHAYNPGTSGTTNEGEEKLPSIYTLGLGLDATPDCFLGACIQKTVNEPVSFNAGIQYRLDSKINARAGIVTGTGSLYFGLGYLMNHIQLDAIASVHPQLGLTPGLQIIFNSSEKQ